MIDAARALRGSIWGVPIGLLLAAGCSESPDRQWGSPHTSLDVSERANDAGLDWSPPSAPSNVEGGDFAQDAAACGADAGSDCSLPAEGPRELREEYAGRCEGDAVVQWGFFTYEATTPADSSARFRIRTAQAHDALARASWTPLITARAPDTQTCSVFGPAPCPIDLYVVLEGAPRAHHAFAELSVILSPSSDGTATPSVQSWNLSYSCPLGT